MTNDDDDRQPRRVVTNDDLDRRLQSVPDATKRAAPFARASPTAKAVGASSESTCAHSTAT